MALALQLAAAGDQRCIGIFASAGEALGFAVANLITLFAPPKVIIAGRAMATSEFFIGPLRETLAALLPPSLADVAQIVVREWSDGIWGRGAAAMTLRDLYGAPWGTTGPARHPRLDRHGRRFAMKRVGVGIIGCGVISAAYLKAARKFPILEIVAVADADPKAAAARGQEFGIPAKSVAALLDDPAIEIVLNLTVPEGACRGRPPGRRGGQACSFGKAAGRQSRRSGRPARGGAGQGGARRLRAGHLPRRRASDRAPTDRRGIDRQADRRHGVLHVPGS